MEDSLLKTFKDEGAWKEFLRYKTEKNQLSRRELADLTAFIDERRFEKLPGLAEFGLPEKKELTKLGSSKKRTVYSYGPDETWALKLLAFGLYRYDSLIPANCFSFRRSQTAATAFDRIMAIPDLSGRTVLKADIHDYFNSIDTDRLMRILREVLADDGELLEGIGSLLNQDKFIWQGETVSGKRGAMAGVPLSSFFANLYLRDLDLCFLEKGIPYFRYSDDMIIFCRDREQAEDCLSRLDSYLSSVGLTLNKSKTCISMPGEKWTFLGFSYSDGQIDLSEATVEKMKGKIRRKAGKLERKKNEKGWSFEKTAAAMIRSFDSRFYDLFGTGTFCWTRFYFPVITTDQGLRTIDRYMQQYLRFLYSGRHYKGNYRITYDDLKKLGYTPLAAEYHRWMDENRKLDQINRNAEQKGTSR